MGEVATISFSLSSTKSNYGGMITPAYFCMDNFNGVPSGIDEPPYIVNPVQNVVFNNYPQTIQVDLDGVATDPDDPDENIVYSIVSNSNPEALTVMMNDRTLVLVRETEDEAEADLVMRAMSDGQFVDFNIHVIIKGVEGLDEKTTNFMAYPNPTSGTLTLTVTEAQQFDYEVYNMSGQAVMRGSVMGQETRIDLSDCTKGVYFVSILWDDNRLMQKVIVE